MTAPTYTSKGARMLRAACEAAQRRGCQIIVAQDASVTYAARVRELESDGLDTSDAQGVADMEATSGRAFLFNPDFPADPHGSASWTARRDTNALQHIRQEDGV